jgi:hypothetical protein
MFKSKVKLKDIAIAAPCPASWQNMTGDDRKRACSLCALTVYNTSAMTKREVEELFAKADGKRVCLQIYRRTDGTMLTKDCPLGKRILDQARRKARIAMAAICGMFSFLPAFADQTAQQDASMDDSTAGAEKADSNKRQPNDRLSGKVSCTAEEADALQSNLTGASQSTGRTVFLQGSSIDLSGGQRMKIGGIIRSASAPNQLGAGALAGVGISSVGISSVGISRALWCI